MDCGEPVLSSLVHDIDSLLSTGPVIYPELMLMLFVYSMHELMFIMLDKSNVIVY